MTEKMKPSGIAWIGDIPHKWNCKQIAFMTDSRSGGTPDRNNLSYWENGTIPWMSSGEVNKVNVYETDEKITEIATRNSSAKIVKANAVMVALNGQGKTKGMSAILRIDSACNQSLCAFSCHEGILHYEYLFWCFQTMYTYLRQMSGDDVRDGLAASYVKKQKIPVPEYQEQRAIADFLDAQCAQIDSVIADIEKQIETLQKYKKSLITEAVTKGLDRSAPMKDSEIEWIGFIPEKWDCKKLKYIISEPLQYGANESGDDYREGHPRYIRITDITEENTLKEEGKLSLPPDIAAPYILRDGDILFARSGATVGKSFFYTMEYGLAAFAGYLIRAKINQDMALPKFVYYSTLGIGYENWKNTVFTQATIQNIGADKYAQFHVTLPGLEEQSGIVEYLDEKCARIDDVVKNKQAQLFTMQQHKKSLIYEYVTGKKRVTEVN